MSQGSLDAPMGEEMRQHQERREFSPAGREPAPLTTGRNGMTHWQEKLRTSRFHYRDGKQGTTIFLEKMTAVTSPWC